MRLQVAGRASEKKCAHFFIESRVFNQHITRVENMNRPAVLGGCHAETEFAPLNGEIGRLSGDAAEGSNAGDVLENLLALANAIDSADKRAA